jgi:subtilisin family serine protease
MKKIPVAVYIAMSIIWTAPVLSAGNDPGHTGKKVYTVQTRQQRPTLDRLLETAMEKGRVNVIARLKIDNIKQLTRNSTRYRNIKPGLKFPAAGHDADLALAKAIGRTSVNVLYQLEGMDYQVNHTYDSVPFLALTVSAETLALLESLPEVTEIYEDKATRLPPLITDPPQSPGQKSSPQLVTSTGVIGARNAWMLGFSGEDWYVAVLDTGILNSHEFFDGKAIIEACYSRGGHCPNNKTSMTGAGAAAPFSNTYDGFDHGTHVAGIAAGNGGMIDDGVAKDSNIIAIQVFTRFSADTCGGSPCIASYDSDQVKALEYIYSLRSKYSIAAINMSLGGGSYSGYCNDEVQKDIINNLKEADIATVIASGNDYACGIVSAPACIEPAVAVGASDNQDNEAIFNNWHITLQEFFAPGYQIRSSTAYSDTSYGYMSGTSMAAPHVTGAWAILKAASPGSGVDAIFYTLQNTGTAIKSPWCGDGSIPRINVDEALIQLLISSGNVSIISLNRGALYFSAVKNGAYTGPQQVSIRNKGNTSLNWTAGPDKSWLGCTPTFGTDSGLITVSVNPAGLSAGSYTGAISITSGGALNSPQTITVYLSVIDAPMDQEPFGTMSTPEPGASVRGSIAITGWALDDVAVERVEIYNGNNYLGDAVFVEGLRPDVEQAYPGYPNNYKAGWGYMLLTHFLPGGGNGSYTLYAKAADASGQTVTLGSSTITVDNANAVKPFGAIDTPAQGGAASGNKYVNWGWVLTPQPNYIPTDGSTINVWVDGVKIGNPAYNIYRSDIAKLFPGYANSNGAIGYLYIDTKAYENGVHTIQWTAKDSDGNGDGIGSRYFTIQNSGSRASASHRANAFFTPGPGLQLSRLPVVRTLPVRVKTGFRVDSPARAVYPGRQGTFSIKIAEMERVEIEFFKTSPLTSNLEPRMFTAKPLPIGATLDGRRGIFYWQPGPGFVGTYDFAFVTKGPSDEWTRVPVRIIIVPHPGVRLNPGSPATVKGDNHETTKDNDNNRLMGDTAGTVRDLGGGQR